MPPQAILFKVSVTIRKQFTERSCGTAVFLVEYRAANLSDPELGNLGAPPMPPYSVSNKAHNLFRAPSRIPLCKWVLPSGTRSNKDKWDVISAALFSTCSRWS